MFSKHNFIFFVLIGAFFLTPFFFSIAHAIVFVTPTPFTAFDNGSPFYNPNSQSFSGMIIAYDVATGGITSDNLDRGVNPYYQGTDSYIDSTLGPTTFQDTCFNSTTLIEGVDASAVNVTAPIQSASNPPVMFYVALAAPQGTSCINGKFTPPEFSLFPLSFPGPFAGNEIVHTGNLDGDSLQDIAFVGGGGTYVIKTGLPNLQNLTSSLSVCVLGITGVCQYSGLAFGDIDSSSVPSLASEIVSNQDTFGPNRIESYSANGIGSFSQSVGFPVLLSTPGASYEDAVAIDDINGDGIFELIKVTEYSTPGVHFTRVDAITPVGSALPSFPVTFSRVVPLASTGIASPAEEIAVIPSASVPNSKDIVVASQGCPCFPSPANTELRLINANGLTVSGWPITIRGYRLSPTVVGNIDGGNDYEIVVLVQAPAGTTGSSPNLYAFKQNGLPVLGFPVNTQSVGGVASPALDGLALGDLDGDGQKEIIVGGGIAVVRGNGTFVAGFPNSSVPQGSRSLVGDVNGDGNPDVVYSSWGGVYIPGMPGYNPIYGGIYALDGTGNLIPGFPITMRRGSSIGGNALAFEDIEGDGLIELVAIENSNFSPNGLVHVFRTLGNMNSVEWGSFQHDSKNTGFIP